MLCPLSAQSSVRSTSFPSFTLPPLHSSTFLLFHNPLCPNSRARFPSSIQLPPAAVKTAPSLNGTLEIVLSALYNPTTNSFANGLRVEAVVYIAKSIARNLMHSAIVNLLLIVSCCAQKPQEAQSAVPALPADIPENAERYSVLIMGNLAGQQAMWTAPDSS